MSNLVEASQTFIRCDSGGRKMPCIMLEVRRFAYSSCSITGLCWAISLTEGVLGGYTGNFYGRLNHACLLTVV